MTKKQQAMATLSSFRQTFKRVVESVTLLILLQCCGVYDVLELYSITLYIGLFLALKFLEDF